MGKTGIKDGFGWVMAAGAFLLAGFSSAPTIVIVLLAAAAGVGYQLFAARKSREMNWNLLLTLFSNFSKPVCLLWAADWQRFRSFRK